MKFKSEKSLSHMYGRGDLSKNPLFQGGFINFGYWDVPSNLSRRISVSQRIRASKNLYRYLLKKLHIHCGQSILEVGCGRGLGCRLADGLYHPCTMVGIDTSPSQIRRAKALIPGSENSEAIEFRVGHAEKMPFQEASVDVIYCVEAAQHFRSCESFSKEAFRVLKKGGSLGVTTFFASEGKYLSQLRRAIPTIQKKIDRVIPIDEFLSYLENAGFVNPRFESIGKRVWQGFDRWMEQRVHEAWAREWFRAYQKGWMDYYVVIAKKGGVRRKPRG